MRGLENLFISWQRQALADQILALLLAMIELPEQGLDISVFKIESGLLDFVLMVYIAVGHHTVASLGPDQVINALNPLQVHGDTLQAVSDLAGDGAAIKAANLLKIGELGHLHAIEPDLPAQPPGPQGRRLPVVLHETDIVDQGINT